MRYFFRELAQRGGGVIRDLRFVNVQLGRTRKEREGAQ